MRDSCIDQVQQLVVCLLIVVKDLACYVDYLDHGSLLELCFLKLNIQLFFTLLANNFESLIPDKGLIAINDLLNAKFGIQINRFVR
jgi:hypothetical protein